MRLKGNPPKSESEKTAQSLKIIRGKQAEVSLNVAIVGGGEACHNLLEILDVDRMSRLRMKILGVSDVNPDAPGFLHAKELNLFTTTDLQELFALEGLNLIIELTGSQEVRDEIFDKKPSGASVIDHLSARLLWDLFQMEMEKTQLERERQRYEERSKKQIQIILDSLPYRLMVVNMDMSVDSVNQTFLRDYNLAREDVLGKHCDEVTSGLDKSYGKTMISSILENGLEKLKEEGLLTAYKEYKDKDGNTCFDVIIITPIYNEGGEIVQILEVSRDVTKRIKLEKEIEKSKTFLQNVIESTVDGIVVVDTKGNVLIFNKGAERLTGYSSEEIMNHGHLTSSYDIGVAKENMRKMRSDQYGPVGKLNPTSITIKTKDGEEIPITLSASIITIDGKEIGSVGVFTDMREILKMRKDLGEAHLSLVESEKIASIGRMAAGVAHEINSPLSGILIYAELLKESLKEKPQHLNDIQEIIHQTLRCKRIVSELLEFSRQSVGKVSSFSLEDLIKKILNILVNQALFQNIIVYEDIEAGIPHIIGDSGQLQQVLINLFINAADAMKGKGKLEIKGRFDPDKNLFIVKVSDTGQGIPEGLRDKIFDIFFTTKPAGKGTGLGLSISQNIIKLHGGNITVDSHPDGGTTFTIELPLGFIEKPYEEPLFIE